MRIFQPLLFLIAGIPFFSYGQAVYDTIERKQTVFFDAAAGGIILYESFATDDYYYYTQIHDFQSSLSFQANVGYALKLDLMKLEWKLGYTQAKYAIDVTSDYYSKGPSTTPTYVGSTTQHAASLQILGVTFGKERSWGGLQIGPHIRYNFWTDAKNSGKTIVEGTHWDGTVLTRVYEESAFEPPLYYSNLTLGLQIGANFKLHTQNEVHIAIELNANGNSLHVYNAAHCFISAGYYFTLKKDRVVMRKY